MSNNRGSLQYVPMPPTFFTISLLLAPWAMTWPIRVVYYLSTAFVAKIDFFRDGLHVLLNRSVIGVDLDNPAVLVGLAADFTVIGAIHYRPSVYFQVVMWVHSLLSVQMGVRRMVLAGRKALMVMRPEHQALRPMITAPSTLLRMRTANPAFFSTCAYSDGSK